MHSNNMLQKGLYNILDIHQGGSGLRNAQTLTEFFDLKTKRKNLYKYIRKVLRFRYTG